MYERIYKRVGGRPWTYIARDWSAGRVAIASFLAGLLVRWPPRLDVMAAFIMGVAIGHIWFAERED